MNAAALTHERACGTARIEFKADGLTVLSDLTGLLAVPFGFGTAVACSTLVYVGNDVAQQIAAARKIHKTLGGKRVDAVSDSSILQENPPSITGTATALDGLFLVRLLANNSAELRSAVMELIRGIRQSAGGLQPCLPRVWYC